MNAFFSKSEIISKLLQPETELEKTILKTSEFESGLFWGKPRFGHPEGQVIYHVKEVLENIDQITSLSTESRQKLRLIAMAHDTFKYKEDKNRKPRDWKKHHGVLARKFMEEYTDQKDVLDIIELHDEAYYSWRMIHLFNQKIDGSLRLQNLLIKVQDFLQLFYLFYKCDTSTGDKNPSPLKWFEETVNPIEIVSLYPAKD